MSAGATLDLRHLVAFFRRLRLFADNRCISSVSPNGTASDSRPSSCTPRNRSLVLHRTVAHGERFVVAWVFDDPMLSKAAPTSNRGPLCAQALAASLVPSRLQWVGFTRISPAPGSMPKEPWAGLTRPGGAAPSPGRGAEGLQPRLRARPRHHGGREIVWVKTPKRGMAGIHRPQVARRNAGFPINLRRFRQQNPPRGVCSTLCGNRNPPGVPRERSAPPKRGRGGVSRRSWAATSGWHQRTGC